MKCRDLVLTVLAVIASCPLGAVAYDKLVVDASILELKKMSKLDRERFDRNLAVFRELPEEQKTQYRRLHDDLAADQKESGGLTPLMETYSVWLLTLSPAQRDELLQEKETAKKIAIVRRLKEEQERTNELHETLNEESLVQANPKNMTKLALDKKDLDAVCYVLVESLSFDHRKPEFDEIGLATYLPIVRESIQQYANNHEWPGDNLTTKILAALRKETAREIQRSPAKRDTLVRMILMGALKLANEQVHDPTADERIETALKLSPDERAKIQKLPPQQVKWAIRKKYYENKGEEAVKQLNQLVLYRRQVVELFDRLGVEVPPILKRPDRPPRGKG